MPGAFVALTGPAVLRKLGEQENSLTTQPISEMFLQKGLIDGVADPLQFRTLVASILAILSPSKSVGINRTVAQVSARPVQHKPAWRYVSQSRRGSRPSAATLLAALATCRISLQGDQIGGGDDRQCDVALARVGGMPVVVVAQLRPCRMDASGYRKAQRGISLAQDLRVPLITIIDTPGVASGLNTEPLHLEVANSITKLMRLRSRRSRFCGVKEVGRGLSPCCRLIASCVLRMLGWLQLHPRQPR